jgi:sulfoxide reductase heme-binding subunit YedZ
MTPPSPLWYTTRASGIVLLVLLTIIVLLGVLSSMRWFSESIPRFVPPGLHRNLSLLAAAFLVLHVATATLDSFAGLRLVDDIVPFVARYRPLWLGLGVISAEIFVLLTVSSLFRQQLGYRLWRLIHWISYAGWPLALLHSIGTGSDTKSGWLLVIYTACVLAVLGAVVWRLFSGAPHRYHWRVAGSMVAGAGTVALVMWVLSGPLRPGWALAAGTPKDLLAQLSRSAQSQQSPGATPTPTPAALPAGLRDSLRGTVQSLDSGGLRISLADRRDPSLGIIVTTSDAQATTVQVEAFINGQSVCSGAAQVTDQAITAPCNGVAIQLINLSQGDDNQVTGDLVTQ